MGTESVDQRRWGHRVGRAFTRLVVTLLVLGLIGTVGFLLSQLNARTFTLSVSNGALTVFKGKMLPLGSQPYRPADPSLAETYAPLPIDNTAIDSSVLQQRFTERDEVDRALFEIIKTLAQPRVIADDPATLERGLYYLRRAQKLTGLTTEQRLALKRMEADIGYYQARLKLEDARRMVAEAMAQLKVAGETPNRHARSANQMISAIEGPAKELENALRSAVHSLSSPAQDLPPVSPNPPTPGAPTRTDVPPGNSVATDGG